ncbi:MAG TPA: CdaR family protein [Anaerolineaceae bacterium]|nr:CdaR family protein [Anaerolineaceae bacterium]
MNRLRAFTKMIPILLTALLVAVAVWIMAVTSSDPDQTKTYPNALPVEIIGQDPGLVIISEIPDTVSLTLRAPASIWTRMITEKAPVRALLDLSGLQSGEHTVPVQIQVGIKPVDVVSYNPRSVSLKLEALSTLSYEIKVITRGALPVGYQSEEPQLSETSATVSGAKSRVDQVAEVQAILDLSKVTSDINESIVLRPVDANGNLVQQVSVFPEKIILVQSVAQRGGYRNVVVKAVTKGQVKLGYRLTSISVFPPTVTVFSSDSAAVDALPGFVETASLDLTGLQDDFESSLDLLLPESLQVIGDQQVLVKVGIEPVQSSLALSDVLVEATGLASNLTVNILPEKVNIIISGPVPLLEKVIARDVRVLIDLTGLLPGKYTLEPKLSLNIEGLTIESISPSTFELEITPIK